jgi:hypothetical protein
VKRREIKTNGKIIVGTAIGLVVGLALGIFISVILNLPNAILPTGTGTNNQVQVSGTVQKTQTGTIYFRNLNRTIETSAPIIDGKYSVLLVGGQSYDVYVNYYSYSTPNYLLYVPSGVATFTADF